MQRFAYLLTLLAFTWTGELNAATRGSVGLTAIPPSLASPRPEIPPGLRSLSDETPCFLLLPAAEADLQVPGRLEPVLDEARQLGLRVVVRLLDEEWSPVEDWSARITSFAQAAGDRVEAYQLFGPDAAKIPPRDYAFLLKNARVAVRAAGSKAPFLSAPLGAADLAWAEALYEEDAAPYLDVVAAQDLDALEGVIALRDRRHARAAIWVTDAHFAPQAALTDAAGTYLQALAHGAEVAIFSTPEAPPEGLGEALSRLRGMFPTGLAPSSAGALPFDPTTAMTGPGGTVPARLDVLSFFDPETRDGLAAYRSTEEVPGLAPGEQAAVRFKLRTPVESLELLAPETGESRVISGAAAAGAVAELPVRPAYLLLRYRVALAALPLKERAEVGAVSELSAEEIIAREREVRGVQNARLTHYEAKATMTIHYRISSLNESIDVTTDNKLFVKEGKQDYQQTALYVNGAVWRGKDPPYLPYIQPGMVGEVPLDISLDERYRYTLDGRNKVDGRDCYVLSFAPIEPIDPSESLFSGHVFIDARVFARVRMEAVQSGLKAPVRSSEVVYRYEPVPADWGDAWLPTSMTGQMTFEVLGYNLVVEREVAYADYVLNPGGFEERRTEAYESGRPVLRETDAGLQRVEIQNGQEVLRSLDTPRNTLLVFGISGGDTGGVSYPFAGVNFFDFNFHDTGTQFNLAWAGPYADVSWTDPDVFGAPNGRRPSALSLQGTFNAFETEDKNATSAGTPSENSIDILRESVRAGFALPMGNFFKWTLEARALYQNFDCRAKTFGCSTDSPNGFTLPVTHVEGGLSLRLEYARLGYLATLWGEASERNRWEPWGLPGQSFSDDDRNFTRLSASLRKAFYFGIYNKLSFGATGYEGRSLDRFSRFELGDFRAARVRGFNDSGIHFDRGLVGEMSYSFPMSRYLRADLGIQEGFVHSQDDFGDGYERVIGSGLSLEFSGPWSTFVTVRLSRALSSTIEDKGGGGDFRLVFFRTFDKWSPKGSRGTPPQ